MLKFSWLLVFLIGLWQIRPNSPIENIIEHPSVAPLLDAEHAEIFQIVPLARYIIDGVNVCADLACVQTYIYDFAQNATVTVISADGDIIDALRIENASPPFNQRIEQMAQTLIANDADVRSAAGELADESEIVIMQMQHPSCPDTHLCVATTLLTDGGSVWVLVDVTDERIVDLWWGDVAVNSGAVNSEQSLFYDCDPHLLERDGWSLEYRITPSDGFAVADVYYDGRQVVSDIRLVQWEANYVNDGNYAYVDYAGCGAQGPGHGFPIDPVGETRIEEIGGGFALHQDFQMPIWGAFCNYRYEQSYEFYTDGRWRIIGTPYGRGCGDGRYKEATYRPIFRIEFALDGIGGDFFQAWDGTEWEPQNVETYFEPKHPVNADLHAFRLLDGDGIGYAMAPGRGQFDDSGTGDEAYTYLTRYNPLEGATDMPSIGDCCQQDHLKPPYLFLNGENTAGEHLVVWYVPEALTQTLFAFQQGNADAPYCWTESTTEYYPCPLGPMFHPVEAPRLAVGLRSADIIPPYLPIVLLTLLLTVTLLWVRKEIVQS